MRKFFSALSIFITFTSQAQQQISTSSADIYLNLKKLNVLGSVLYFAAHPDDENTRLLAYFAKDQQYRTGYMSLTRGDGGQNLIGDEQGIELGLIRTQELLAARRIDGAEQFFSTAIDFGFSKNATEAFRIWNHDKILADAVWVIRKFQPDVIITRFPPDERAGHGHHWASSILAHEAFDAAADPQKFPEQLTQGVTTWQAKRLFWNNYNFGGNNNTAEDQFKIDIGAYNPLLGKGYGELAAESRSQHKSQGFGVPKQRGASVEYFSLTAGTPVKDNILDGVTTTWERVQGGTAIQTSINSIIAGYNFEHPEKSVDSLVALYNKINALPASYWKAKKLEEVKAVLVACSGLFIEAITTKQYAITGDVLPVTFVVNKRNNATVTLNKIQLDGYDSTVNNNLPLNANINVTKAFAVTKNKPLSQPYWLANPSLQGSFVVNDQQLIGKAENDADYKAHFTLVFGGNTNIDIERPLQYKFSDAIKGEIYEPLTVISPFIISATPGIELMNVHDINGKPAQQVMKITFKSNLTIAQLPITIETKQKGALIYSKDTTLNAEAGKEYIFTTNLDKTKFNTTTDASIQVAAVVKINGATSTYQNYLRSIHYDHIPDLHYSFRDNVKVLTEEIKTKGRNIGYIVGAGDKVPQALQQMGYEVKLLTENDITTANLAKYDAIFTGIRAYNLHEWLPAKYDVLMNYIKQGGNFIVQYNQQDVVTDKIGPYPFTISRTRVTDETAEVHFLQPTTSVLNYPNKITAKDFENWIQERSIYHAQGFDTHYTAPIGMHDPNEAESNGSLIVAPFGKGNFVYTGIVFFRELPAGEAGAYRLLANIIALPKN